MAKPYGTQAGSGMHVHFSMLDEQGRNIYVGEDGPSEALMHSVGGLLDNMAASMAIFAPHANSYRRLRPSEHAPTYASWGFDNRSAAVRCHHGVKACDPHRASRGGCGYQPLSGAGDDPFGGACRHEGKDPPSGGAISGGRPRRDP